MKNIFLGSLVGILGCATAVAQVEQLSNTYLHNDTYDTINVNTTGLASTSWYMLTQRHGYTNSAVALMRPHTTNAVMALDIAPNGTPCTAGTCQMAWIDVCDVDLYTGQPPFGCSVVATDGVYAIFGSHDQGIAVQPVCIVVGLTNTGPPVCTEELNANGALVTGSLMLAPNQSAVAGADGFYNFGPHQIDVEINGTYIGGFDSRGMDGIAIGSSTPAAGTFTTLKATRLTTGTAADTVCMASGGEFIIQATACTNSSRRFKEHIKAFKEDALSDISLLSVMSFNLKQQDETPNRDPNFATDQVGLLAEDVARVMPKCALYENDMKTPKSYRQECVIAYLVKGTQELIEQNKALMARVAKLEQSMH